MPDVQPPLHQAETCSNAITEDEDESHFCECTTEALYSHDLSTVVRTLDPSEDSSGEGDDIESEEDANSYVYVRENDYYGGTRGWPFTSFPTINQHSPFYFLFPWPEPDESRTSPTPCRLTPSGTSSFLRLPPEIRFNVYDRLLPSKVSIIPFPLDEHTNRLPWALSSLSPEMYEDALPVLYRSVTVVIWTKNEWTFRGTHRQAYQAWLAEIDNGAASMIKNLIIDEIFSVRKLEGDIQPATDEDSSVQLFDIDEPTPCCEFGFKCSDTCSDPYCSKYDVDLKNVNTMGVSTSSGNWEIKWIWEFDVDKSDRLAAMMLVLGEIPARLKTGLGKEAIKGLVRAACGVEVETIRREGSEGVFENEVWPKRIYPHSWAWMRQRIRRQPYEE